MNPHSRSESDSRLLRLWVERARKNSPRCNLCLRISREYANGDGDLRGFKVFRVEFSPETQIAHLAVCVGKELTGA